METFQVAIVGCGATFPSNRHLTSTQMVNIHEKIFKTTEHTESQGYEIRVFLCVPWLNNR